MLKEKIETGPVDEKGQDESSVQTRAVQMNRAVERTPVTSPKKLRKSNQRASKPKTINFINHFIGPPKAYRRTYVASRHPQT